MPETHLQIKKLYINSEHKTPDSTASNFKIQLDRSIDLPDKCYFHLDDLVMPRTFKTVEKDVNDKLYIALSKFTDTSFANTDYILITIPEGNYTTDTFTTALQTQFDTLTFPEGGAPETGNLLAQYDDTAETLTIRLADIPTNAGYYIYIFDDHSLKTTTRWEYRAIIPGSGIKFSDPQSINHMIGNTEMNSLQYNSTNFFYVCTFLNLNPIREIYISSPNLGGFNTLSSNGSQNYLMKVVVNVPFGYIITNTHREPYNILNASRQTLSSLEFSIRDSSGRLINMRKQAVTFSIIFTTPDQH
jgi:hypothetical protein